MDMDKEGDLATEMNKLIWCDLLLAIILVNQDEQNIFSFLRMVMSNES